MQSVAQGPDVPQWRPQWPGRATHRALIALGGLALASACAQDSSVAGILVIATIEVTPPSAGVVAGQSLQLTAIPRTEGGIVLPADHITWSSTDETKATVSSDGLVRAVSVGGPVRIRATMDGVTGETQITVLPFPVDRVVVAPPSIAIQVGQSAQLTPTAFDASGSPLTGRQFTWATASPGIAAVTTTGMVIGMAPGGPVTITATSEGKSGSSSVTVLRPATRLGFLQQPGTTTAGAAITPAVTVAVQDDLHGTVTSAVNAVTIDLGSNPGGATLTGNRTVTAVNGIATFPNLSLNRAAAGYTLVATAQALTPATSAAFNVIAGAAKQLSFTVAPPTTAASGIAFAAAPVVQVTDASGNPVGTSGILVSASIPAGTGTLGGTTTATTNAAGAATFTGLLISGPIGAYTLTFSAPGLTPLNSASIALTAGNPASLSIITQPAATAQSGIPLSRQPVLRLRDGAGNPVSRSGVEVTAAIASGPAGGTLGGTTVVSTDGSGVATFTNLALTGPAGSYTLGFSSAGLPTITSSAISLTLLPGPAAQLTITTQPSAAATNGVPFPQQPVVQVRDAGGNAVSGALVSAAIASGGGSLGGSGTATSDANGMAAFSGLSITGLAGAYTLSFGVAGASPVVSSSIALGAGPASQLIISTQPSATAQNGVPFPQQPAVTVADASGNPVSGVAVTSAIASGGGTLGGISTATTDASGIAAFSDLSISGTLGSRTLSFTASGLTAVMSNAIELTAGPATQLVIVQQPSSIVHHGDRFAPQPIVQLLDAGGNPVAGGTVTAAINSAVGSGKLSGDRSITTDAAGLATFTDLKIDKAGFYTLIFSFGGLTVVSDLITVT